MKDLATITDPRTRQPISKLQILELLSAAATEEGRNGWKASTREARAVLDISMDEAGTVEAARAQAEFYADTTKVTNYVGDFFQEQLRDVEGHNHAAAEVLLGIKGKEYWNE